jgi:hypothetical protein
MSAYEGRQERGPAREAQAQANEAEHDPATLEVAPDSYAATAGAYRAREAAWRQEAAPIAAELGVSPEIRSNEESRALNDARGSQGLAIGNVIHLHPDKLRPGTALGKQVLTHELVHIAQSKKRAGRLGREGAEREAHTIAEDAAAGAPLRAPDAGLSLDQAAADQDGAAAADKDKKPLTAPDLKGAPYQWVPGTFNLWLSRDWFSSAPDFSDLGDEWSAPSRIREMLMVLRDKGMLTWPTPERIEQASKTLGIPSSGTPVRLISLGTSAFHTFGLPPGTSALSGRNASKGIEVVLQVPAGNAVEGKDFPLSPESKAQLVDAVGSFTKLKVDPGVRKQMIEAEQSASLNAGTVWFTFDQANCELLFGKEAYDKWIDAPADESKSPFQFDVGAGNESFGDLTPDEVVFVKDWIKNNLGDKSKGGGQPMVVERSFLEALKKIDDLPKERRERVIAMLRGDGKVHEAQQGQFTAATLERVMQRAKFDEEREAAGFKPDKHDGHERPPTFDYPLPARIDQKNGLIIAGENVDFNVLINWPPAYTSDQASDYTWRPMRASIDWMFERQVPGKGAVQSRQTSYADWNSNGNTKHRFDLEKGEDQAVWTVHAFVQHNFFQPNHLTTQVEVKTEEKRMEELRKESFGQLGQPAIADKDYDFSTSTFNEWFGDHDYDHGLRFRGELPKDFKRRTPEERKAALQQELATNQQMLQYLQNEGTHPDAVAACEHYIAKLQDALQAMDDDVQEGWQPFEVRGAFLGRGNHVVDGPLDLYGMVRRQTHHSAGLDEYDPGSDYEQVHVQIRDLSRKLEAENYRFEGSGDTFEDALESCFVDLCKKYPGGKVTMLAEGFDADGKQGSGKTVGFELDTGTAWKDVKAKVFDPVVNIAVNIAGAIASIFVPEIAIPLLIIYNEAQNVDSLVDELDSGTFTAKKGVMHLAQLGLDIMPVAGRAPIFRTTKTAWAMFHVASLGGQALLMKTQVDEQIAQIRDGQVKDMAELFAKYVDLEKNTQASDPARTQMKAELDKKADEIRATSTQVWEAAIEQFAIVAIPSHAAGMLGENLRVGKLGELEGGGRFVNKKGVEPFYDRTTGRIIGDQSHMDFPTIRKLTAEQDAHVRELGGRLAQDLGVTPDKLVVKPADPGDGNKIWKDGDQIQVRYEPGTDPEKALTTWETEAQKQKIGKPAPGHSPEHPTPAPHEPAPPVSHEVPATEHPRTHNDHETVSETAKVEPELAGGGASQAKETTAAAVAGSDFHGAARDRSAANTQEVMTEARAVFETTALGYSEVDKVEKVSSADIPDRSKYSRDEKVRLEDTYLVTMKDGSRFTIRITSGPVSGDVIARTVINTTKEGVTRVGRGGPTPDEVTVKGRYVVQLNDRMEPANAERGISHEVGEILAERELAAAKKPAGPDLLRQGEAPEDGAILSPNDRGRLGEVKAIAPNVNGGDAGKTRELLALVEELGLRDGQVGAAERQHLVRQALADDPTAVRALEKAWRSDATLEPDLKSQLDSVRAQRQAELDAAATRKAAEPTVHDTPDARPEPGKLISPERAHEMALQAAVARANKSAATLRDLRAQAARLPEGHYPKVKDVQIGGGASLAARDKDALLIDARGRWQADASDRIAQTAQQLAGLKDAGIGDPFQFAQPDERVPMSAVRYWEDSIAAQGPVIDGEVVGMSFTDDGRTILAVQPKEGGPVLHLEVEGAGNISASTGFPVERIPGTPRGMSPDRAIEQIKAKLHGFIDDPATKSGRKAQARGALAEIETLSGQETTPGQREHDLAKAHDALERHGLDAAIKNDAATKDAHEMVVAGDKWADLEKTHPDKIVLGDMANLERFDPTVTDKWIIGGPGGTGISAAEIVLAKNEHAHVTMVGDTPPDGLMENDQFRSVLKAHADQQTVDLVKKLFGVNITKGDGRFSLVFGVSVETPAVDARGNVRATGKAWRPTSCPTATPPRTTRSRVAATSRRSAATASCRRWSPSCAPASRRAAAR